MGDFRKIDRFSARQHGVFSGSQARSAGFDKHAVGRKLASGDWRQFDYRVFGLASAAPTWERQMWVALLSRPRAVVGGRAAGYLHGFRGFRRVRRVIVVPGSSNARSQIAKVIRAEHFEELEVVHARGFPVTSIPETLVTLVGEMSPIRFQDLFEDLLLSGLFDLGHVARLVEREQDGAVGGSFCCAIWSSITRRLRPRRMRAIWSDGWRGYSRRPASRPGLVSIPSPFGGEPHVWMCSSRPGISSSKPTDATGMHESRRSKRIDIVTTSSP